jgi:pimeloyl-ACP methyl ester carboxylesterase
MSNIAIKEILLTNGEKITYREREGGEKLVLLIHGNMTSSKHWDLVLENMDSSFKIYAIDLRGFGGSSYIQPIQSIKDFSDDVKLFVDELGLKDFSMVGWSTGGGVAMQFAADYPGYCNKLILLASVSTRGYPAIGKTKEFEELYRLKTYEEAKLDLMKAIPIQAAYDRRDRDLLKTIYNALLYDRNQPNPQQYEDYIDDMFTQRNYAEVYHALNHFNISSVNNGLVDGNRKASEINVPVLIMHGEKDLVISNEMKEELVNDLAHVATLVELKGCGHSALIDDLEQLLNEMSKFLNNRGAKVEIKG